MAQPIRIAVIGTGLIVSSMHWPALATLPDDFQVVSLANRTPARAEKLANIIQASTGVRPSVYGDYHRMLVSEKLDAVLLALPPTLNPEVAQAVLAAGCHVIAEKPIAANLADGRRMLPWAERYGRVLMIAENYRYIASFRRAAQLIADDAIGQPQIARWSVYAYIGPDSPYYHTPWRLHPEHPGGYLSDGGVHDAAALRMLLGEVETVSGLVTSARPDLPPADTLSATLRFANGALGTYATTHALPGPETALQIAGPKGVLLVWQDRVELWRKGQKTREWAEPSPEHGTVAMYRDFARAMRTGRPPRSTPAEALADLQLIVAILRSSETGQAVRVAGVE